MPVLLAGATGVRSGWVSLSRDGQTLAVTVGDQGGVVLAFSPSATLTPQGSQGFFRVLSLGQ